MKMDGTLSKAIKHSLSWDAHSMQQSCQNGRKQGKTPTRPKGCTTETKGHGINLTKWQKAG
jgi:hypothetical protein